MAARLKSQVGHPYNQWVVDYEFYKDGQRWCGCTCSCGYKKEVRLQDLRSGLSKSCGCSRLGINSTHKLSSTAEYKAWQAAKKRCYKTDEKDYHHYGRRGIRMCSGWLNSPESFVTDNGPRPSPELEMDRIDNDGNYSCGHCSECLANGWPKNTRWATRSQQCSNRRSSEQVRQDNRNQGIY